MSKPVNVRAPKPEILPADPAFDAAVERGELLMITDIMRLKHVGRNTVNQAMLDGALSGFAARSLDSPRVSYRWLFRREDVEAWEPPAPKKRESYKNDTTDDYSFPTVKKQINRRSTVKLGDIQRCKKLYRERERERARLAALVPDKPWPKSRGAAWLPVDFGVR